jgi:hypothetical protein
MGSFTSKLVTAGVEISMDGRGRFMDCEFRGNPAGDSDLMSATVPI